MFAHKRLLSFIIKNLQSNKITAYDTLDDRFTDTLPQLKFKGIDINAFWLISIQLKEEFIFDMNRLVSEYRIIGICPVVKLNNITRPLCWIYYPDIRKYLSDEKINDKTMPQWVKTLDDFFFTVAFPVQ